VPSVSRVNAHIQLGRKDSWRSVGKGEGRELAVYAAFIRGDVRPHGLRRIISMFPLSISVISSITFFVLSLLVLMVCLGSSMRWRHSREDSTVVRGSSGPVEIKRRGSSMRRSQAQLEPTAQEVATPHTYPSPEPEPGIVLRRRRTSSTSQGGT